MQNIEFIQSKHQKRRGMMEYVSERYCLIITA